MTTTEMTEEIIKFYKTSTNATLPSRGSSQAACLDLHAAQHLIIPPLGKGFVFTDLIALVPTGCYGRIAGRSGLAIRNHITITGGVIDSDYRGNIGIIIFNNNPVRFFEVNIGDRIAQLICERISLPKVQECFSLQEMIMTERGSQGFRSTGV